ncbi:MAG: 50S ribosomal protein L6 [Candidatus Brocadiaceae bacterium]|nr:50S ribosomal protein L6 [Candidatus Brocadiaceae bacterium]
MSRIGKQPVDVPSDVKVTVSGSTITVEGPKGKLSRTVNPGILVKYEQQEKKILVTRKSDAKYYKSLHGLFRSLISNMITGVTKGFSRDLEIVGLGYNAKLQGRDLVLSLGFSHPVRMVIPGEIDIKITNPSNPAKLTVSGIDKQLVGQISAKIRDKKPPEPYKGMGIKYADEVIRRKAGKALSSGG